MAGIGPLLAPGVKQRADFPPTRREPQRKKIALSPAGDDLRDETAPIQLLRF
jgi:hypothetical protein